MDSHYDVAEDTTIDYSDSKLVGAFVKKILNTMSKGKEITAVG